MEETPVQTSRAKFEAVLRILLRAAYAKLKDCRSVPLPPLDHIEFVIANTRDEYNAGLADESGYSETMEALWTHMATDHRFRYLEAMRRRMNPKPLVRLRVRCPDYFTGDDMWFLHLIEIGAH